MKHKIYHIVKTIPKSNLVIIETKATWIPLKHVYITTHISWLGTVTSINGHKFKVNKSRKYHDMVKNEKQTKDMYKHRKIKTNNIDL